MLDEMRDIVKFPDQFAKTFKERVWTSLVWHTPKSINNYKKVLLRTINFIKHIVRKYNILIGNNISR